MEKKRTIELEAKEENLVMVFEAIEDFFGSGDISDGTVKKLKLVLEEGFINIVHYAYKDGENGKIILKLQLTEEKEAVITLKDRGVPFNPLKKEDPDVNKPAAERPIGGLGIFLMKQLMDEVSYEYLEGYNILTMHKKDN